MVLHKKHFVKNIRPACPQKNTAQSHALRGAEGSTFAAQAASSFFLRRRLGVVPRSVKEAGAAVTAGFSAERVE